MSEVIIVETVETTVTPRNPRRMWASALVVVALGIDCAGAALVWLGTGMGIAFGRFGADKLQTAENGKQFVTGLGASAVATAGDVVIAIPGVFILTIGLMLSVAAVILSREGGTRSPSIGITVFAAVNLVAVIASIVRVFT